MKTIVISAVNIVEAGPLTILRDCLSALSQWVAGREGEYRVIAIVYKRDLADYPYIEYIETQWPKKRWINRLWYEYVNMKKISEEIGTVYLWVSLHDTSPDVVAEHRVVYCHNALFSYRWKLHDLLFAPKMVILAMLTKFIYLRNIHRNRYVVVQQEWFRKAMNRMFAIDRNKIIVAPPTQLKTNAHTQRTIRFPDREVSFIYPASPNPHKNFEVICRAVNLLENHYHIRDFKVYITVRGNENKYAKWLYKNWGQLASIQFVGFLSKGELLNYYNTCNGLIYPSKVESWGLPISEFAVYNKYMLLADMPYAYETAGGCDHTAFFDPDNPVDLAKLMVQLIKGENQDFKPVPTTTIAEPIAKDWSDLLCILIGDSMDRKHEELGT